MRKDDSFTGKFTEIARERGDVMTTEEKGKDWLYKILKYTD